MTASTYPWALNTAAQAITNRDGSITVDLKLDELLGNVPETFNKLAGIGSIFGKPYEWPLQSKVDGSIVNGLPIDLTLTVPEGVRLVNSPVITDSTSGVDYSWADNGSSNLFSKQEVVVTDEHTAQIHLKLGYIQYGTLINAIENKTIGSWSVTIPTAYSIEKGAQVDTETMTLTGKAGSPYHKAGGSIGIEMEINTNILDCTASAFSAQEIKPAGTVNNTIHVKSGLLINGAAQTEAELKKGEDFSLTGTLDITPIKETVLEKVDKYGVGALLKKVDIHNLSLEMKSGILLPGCAEWNESTGSAAFEDENSNFAISQVEYDQNALVITYGLKDPNSISTLQDLVNLMNATPDTLKIRIDGLRAVQTTNDETNEIGGTVTGSFKADALLPAAAAIPGYFDITYTFNDTVRPVIALSIIENNAGEVPGEKPGQTPDEKPNEVQIVSLYRLYNPNSGEHFYTQDLHEREVLISLGWNDEKIGWKSPETSDTPVYRLYNKNAGDHHFTTSEKEKDTLVKKGWTYEGIAFYSLKENEGLPVLREYNPNAKAGAHNYTLDQVEHDFLVSIGWNDEGVAWYAYSNK